MVHSFQHIMGPNLERATGRDAWKQNLTIAHLAAWKVATSLGPRGSYKLVSYNRGPEFVVKVTKDPVEVAKELGVQYPSVKILSEAAELHRTLVGDGVVRLLIMISSLLEKAETLITKEVHPMTILDGYHEAARNALTYLDEASRDPDETSSLRTLEVVDCGRNLLSLKLRKEITDAVRNSCVNGVSELKRVRVMKKEGGSIGDSHLLRAVVMTKTKLHPNMADVIASPRVALVASGIGAKRLEVKMQGEGLFPFEINIRDEHDISRFKKEERKLKLEIVDDIASTGANSVFCRSQIPDTVGALLASKGIFALSMVDQDDIDALSFVTGAKVVGRAEDLEPSDIGLADRIEVGKNGNLDIVTVESPKASTLLLRGASPASIDELERVVKAAKTVSELALKAPKVVPGAGAAETEIARKLRRHALRFSGKQQLAIDAFAESIEEIPTQLATNFGLDPIDTMIELKWHHSEGRLAYGVMLDGCADAAKNGVIELALISKATINRAYELASLMLRVDDFVHSTDIAKVHKQ